MAMKRLLSQQEIDSLFGGMSRAANDDGHVAPFDFSRLDRIPKSQVRVVHALFDTFTRNLATSLQGYLRTYVNPNLVSLEQISYGEFLEALEMPTCIAYVGLRPFDGTMIVDLGRSMVFGAVELLLGGDPHDAAPPTRKLTDIEKNLVQNLMRVILADFRDAWRPVADIDFQVQSLADDPHGLRVLTSAEAILSVSIEVKVGTATNMINMAIPSIFIKRLRDRLDRLQTVQRASSRSDDQARMAKLLRHAAIDFEARLDGGLIASRDVAGLTVGEVVMLDHPVGHPVGAYVNGRSMFLGQLGSTEGRLQYTVSQRVEVE